MALNPPTIFGNALTYITNNVEGTPYYGCPHMETEFGYAPVRAEKLLSCSYARWRVELPTGQNQPLRVNTDLVMNITGCMTVEANGDPYPVKDFDENVFPLPLRNLCFTQLIFVDIYGPIRYDAIWLNPEKVNLNQYEIAGIYYCSQGGISYNHQRHQHQQLRDSVPAAANKIAKI